MAMKEMDFKSGVKTKPDPLLKVLVGARPVPGFCPALPSLATTHHMFQHGALQMSATQQRSCGSPVLATRQMFSTVWTLMSATTQQRWCGRTGQYWAACRRDIRLRHLDRGGLLRARSSSWRGLRVVPGLRVQHNEPYVILLLEGEIEHRHTEFERLRAKPEHVYAPHALVNPEGTRIYMNSQRKMRSRSQ